MIYCAKTLMDAARARLLAGHGHYGIDDMYGMWEELHDLRVARLYRTLVPAEAYDAEDFACELFERFEDEIPERGAYEALWRIPWEVLRREAGLEEQSKVLDWLSINVGAGGMGEATVAFWMVGLTPDLAVIIQDGDGELTRWSRPVAVVPRDARVRGLGTLLRASCPGAMAVTFMVRSSGGEHFHSTLAATDLVRIILYGDGLLGSEVWTMDVLDLLEQPLPGYAEYDWADLIDAVDGGAIGPETPGGAREPANR